MRILAGLWLLAELAVYVLVAGWIGIGWTILATLVTSALGWALLARQGTRALAELRERMKDPAAPRPSHARGGTLQRGQLGDAGLAALGGLLMILPGFVGDLVGLICLLPGTRALPRLVLGRALSARLPDRMRGPVRVESTRAGQFQPWADGPSPGEPWRTEAQRLEHPVIEGEVVGDQTPAR
jgi:UPF0716 protein FxsA